MFQEMQNEISKEALGEILFCFVTYTFTVFFLFLNFDFNSKISLRGPLGYRTFERGSLVS